MPYKDPERYREYQRRKQREYAALRRAQDPEKERERHRRYREANRDEINERARARWDAYYARNGERERARQREYNARNREKIRERYDPARKRWEKIRREHGLWPEEWAALYEAQDGRCYLCGKEMTPEDAVIDHDHSCCPPPRGSCRICQRGLAHSGCNGLIGMAADDPGQLRRIADALEAAQLEVKHRKATAGAAEQLRLIE